MAATMTMENMDDFIKWPKGEVKRKDLSPQRAKKKKAGKEDER